VTLDLPGLGRFAAELAAAIAEGKARLRFTAGGPRAAPGQPEPIPVPVDRA
jgi:hypothetical protein